MGGRLLAVASLIALLSCGAGDEPAPQEIVSEVPRAAVPASQRSTQAKLLFGSKGTPSSHDSIAYGSYAKGCLAGGVELAETGPTWQAMRLSRKRNWGHPELVDFVQQLSKVAAKQPGWNGLYVGDMSQARGGPMLSGHRSHQMGLDVDIWLRPAVNLQLPPKAREHISSISMRKLRGAYVNDGWSRAHHEIIKAAAKDPRVARIFVFPGAKVQMCDDERGDKAWLHKVRPWFGHHYHFHVRLHCPDGSKHCENQDDPPKGNGCQDARDWVADILDPPLPDPKRPPPKPRKELLLSDLPAQCVTVLNSQ